MSDLDLGTTLRGLRAARGLSLTEAALRANLSKAAVCSWESGARRPRGDAFVRLLDELGPEPRLRARLLHEVDPAHARLVLHPTALGAPVDLGLVIRAMRLRRSATQADLARSVGVTQATVARWESGDATPTGTTIQDLCFALGASPEEATALTCAVGIPSTELPDDPMEALGSLPGLLIVPMDLSEVVALGFEADLWRRTVRDSAWDRPLAYTTAHRALQYFLNGRLTEAEDTARRALKIASTTETRGETTVAVSALLEVATCKGAEPGSLAAKLEAWIGRMPDSRNKAWMMWERALRLAELGKAQEAIELTERMAEVTARHWTTTQENLEVSLANAFLEVEIRLSRPGRTEALLRRHEQGKMPYKSRWRVRVAHAAGVPADDSAFEAMLTEAVDSRDDHWYSGEKLARIKRKQARLTRAA